MAGVIDTNLLLYAVNTDSPLHGAARQFLDDALGSRQTWFTSEGILYEFLRVATHVRVFPRPLPAADALRFVRAFASNPAIEILGAGTSHWETLQAVLAGISHPAGNLFFDIQTVTLMRENGVRTIYTADTDFLQFDEIKVVNPVAGGGV